MSFAEGRACVYMRGDVKVEPLSWGWYAWGHLISPIQHALNITARQVPLLKSFLANPAVHYAAAKDTALTGAPFVSLGSDSLSAVTKQLAQIVGQGAALIRFAEEWTRFEQQLRERATGFSLEDSYEAIPDLLRGLVELTYDLNNNPCLRPIEELVARADLDDSAGQQLHLFSVADTERKFFLNTPRLKGPDNLILSLPFADERIDTLARSRIGPAIYPKLAEKLHITADQADRFAQLFTTSPPERDAPDYRGEGVRVRYFGHACVLVQTSSVSILIDPIVACGRDDAEARLTFDDLPDKIDFVFITHNHQDHFCPEILLQLRHRIGRVLVPRNNPENIADPSLKLTLRKMGFSNIVVMDHFDSVEVPDGAIISTPFYGEHADLNIHSKQGMYLRLKGRSWAFLADSNCLDRALYRHVARELGPVDTLFIGMECDGAPMSWLYSPYFFTPIKRRDDESRRLSGSNCERAWAAIEELGCKSVFIYAMGQEPWLQHLCGLRYSPDSKQIVESNKLIERCRASQIPAERLLGCRNLSL